MHDFHTLSPFSFLPGQFSVFGQTYALAEKAENHRFHVCPTLP